MKSSIFNLRISGTNKKFTYFFIQHFESYLTPNVNENEVNNTFFKTISSRILREKGL